MGGRSLYGTGIGIWGGVCGGRARPLSASACGQPRLSLRVTMSGPDID